MKSPIALLSSIGLVAVLLSGCGQTGPLYMPNPPARPAPPAAVAEQPAQPVPSNNASVPAPTK